MLVPRTLARWLMSIVFACLALITINLLLTKPAARASHASTLINCSGSIQACIDAASDGDTILIAAGIYTESLTLSKPVSVTGVNSATTILHAVAGQRVLTVTGSTISNSVVISGLTFMGGTADYGGGIYSDVPLIVQNSRFVSNTAGMGNGGGLFANDALTITNSTFIGNTGIPAGGLRARGTRVTLADTDFLENTGGAMILSQYLVPSEVHISGGRFARNSAGGLIVNGSLEMTGTSIVSNTGANSVNVWRGAAHLSNVRFENNSCTAGQNCDAGGLYFYGDQGPSQPYAALTLSNTAFISNSPGGVYAYRSSQVLVTNGNFERNSTPNYGGGLWSYDSPVTLIDTTFQSNTAAFAGGGFFAISPTLVTNTRFISNSAQLDGGGAYFGDAEIYNSRFEGNSSNESGGGFLASSGLWLSNTDVIDNQSSCQSRASGCGGGGAYAFDDATIVKSHFEDNAVMNNGSGGGLFASRAVTMSNVYLINNTVQQSGGGAYITGLANIDHSRFESNSAQFTGGGLYADYTTTLTNTDFISNLADSGGGLFTNRTLWVTGGRFIGNRCRGITCGGGAVLVGSTPAIYANLIVMNSQFIGNTATTTDSIGGAVYYGSSGAVHVVNTLFARNVAQKYGAALFLNWGTVANLDYLTVAGKSLNPIAALTVYSSMPVAINNSIIVSHAIGIQNLAGGVLASNNLFFGNSTNATGAIGGGPSFVGDPKFADSLHDNYHLQFGSAAIDRGINVGVYTDLDGYPRPIGPRFDIGAYEYAGITYRRYLPLIHK